jgi:hypothetical protein
MMTSVSGNTGKFDAQGLKKLIYAEGIDLVGIADAKNLMLVTIFVAVMFACRDVHQR